VLSNLPRSCIHPMTPPVRSATAAAARRVDTQAQAAQPAQAAQRHPLLPAAAAQGAVAVAGTQAAARAAAAARLQLQDLSGALDARRVVCQLHGRRVAAEKRGVVWV
jgi:hypothetical protein